MYLQETDEVTRLYCTICLMNHLMSSTSFHSSFLSFILFPFILSGSVFPPPSCFFIFPSFYKPSTPFFPPFSILALIFNFILYLYPYSPSCFSLSLLSFSFLSSSLSLFLFPFYLPSLHPCSPFLFSSVSNLALPFRFVPIFILALFFFFLP